MKKTILHQKKSFDYFINNINEDDLIKLSDLFVMFGNGNIFFYGVGKSANVAKHVSDILKCISFKSFSLNLQDSMHGDSGCIKKEDLCIFISNSGNTKEIINMIDNIDCYKVLVTSNYNCVIKKKVMKTFVIPCDKELIETIGTIPTNSIVFTIMYFNLCIDYIIIKKNISNDEYTKYHLNGNIGFLNKKIVNFINRENNIICDKNITINDAICLLEKNKTGIIAFENNEKFIGIITIKDIIMLYKTDIDKNKVITDYINTNPIYIHSDEIRIKDCITILKKYKFHKYLPVVKDNKFVGYINLEKIFDELS